MLPIVAGLLLVGAIIVSLFVLGVSYGIYRLFRYLYGNRNGNPRN